MELSLRQKWMLKRSTARINICEGSVRSGKTVGCDIKLIQKLPTISKAGDILLIGKTLSSLRRNVVNSLLKYLGSDARFFPGKQELHIWDRILYCIGASDSSAEGKIRGSTIAYAYGDEITLWPPNFFKMLDSRLSLSTSQFIGTTNADNPNHWLKTDYLDREHELDLKVFKFRLEHNDFLDLQYIENMKKNYVGLWYDRFIKGLWTVAEGAVFDFFDKAFHVLSKPPKADYYDITVDYGTSNPTVFLLMGNSYPAKPYVWAEQEYYYDSKKKQKQQTDLQYAMSFLHFAAKYSNTYDRIIERILGVDELLNIKNKREKNTPIHNVFIDPSAASFKLQLKRLGVMGVKEADNSVIDGIRCVATMLHSGAYKICGACSNYIKEMFSYMWKSQATDKGIDEPIKKNDHCQDAARYHLYTKFGRKNVVNLEKLTKY